MKWIFLFFLLLGSCTGLRAQWSGNSTENTQLTDATQYTWEVAYRADGGFYVFYDRPEVSAGNVDEANSRIIPFLSSFDKNGKPMWGPLRLADEPTLSYTKAMQHLLVDAQGNVVVAVQNSKTGYGEPYTLYKLDVTGKHLWDERGIDLQEAGCNMPSPGALQMVQLTDGNYLFAWMDISGGLFSNIFLQKITKEGKLLWGSGKDMGGGDYPYLVDAGDGDIILVYQYGNIQARKLDFSGEDLWAEPAVVFDGDLPQQIPLWTYISVVPVNNGVVVGYIGFDGNSAHYTLISAIDANGKHMFPDAEKGLRLGYSGNWGFEPVLAYDEEEQAIYAVWRENAPGTNFVSRFCSQKIGLDGELLWDTEGVELLPFKERALGYQTITLGPKGTVLSGFMEHGGNGVAANDPIRVHAALQNADGSFVWQTDTKLVSDYESCKYSLHCSPYINGQWVFAWEDCRVNGGADNGFLFAQNLRADGSLGGTVSNECPSAMQASLRIVPNPASGQIRIFCDIPSGSGKDVRLSLLDMNGSEIVEIYQGRMQEGENRIEYTLPAGLSSGLYLLKSASGESVSYTKMVVR